MAVKRIVANISCDRPQDAATFYGDVLGLDCAMDLGWVATYASSAAPTAQVSFASEGGSGTQVPDLSVEVDNFDAVHNRITAAGHQIEYGPAIEPWGVKRFFVRDPFGRLINIMTHI